MPRTQVPLRPVSVDYVCDECGKGHYRPTGVMLTSNPPQFPHACTECGDKKTFTEKYPQLRWAREGELLDLDNYVETTY